MNTISTQPELFTSLEYCDVSAILVKDEIVSEFGTA
jgi:hypothetical protein